jgi:hypothetical protein
MDRGMLGAKKALRGKLIVLYAELAEGRVGVDCASCAPTDRRGPKPDSDTRAAGLATGILDCEAADEALGVGDGTLDRFTEVTRLLAGV